MTFLPNPSEPEQFSELLRANHLRIERIVSRGHTSPPGFWYDQDQAEWVMVLQGAARIAFADGESSAELQAGDFLNIPAHKRHRVEWTATDEPTVWLAVYYGE